MNIKTILIVEDELPLQKAIRIKLEKSNFEVVTARSVAQALNHLKDVEIVDAIWLDHYLLGKETGLDFVAKIKQHSDFKNIPVFIVSNTATPDKAKLYLHLGVEKYYMKSDFRLDQIIEDIKNNLKK
jgi:two-component system, chemotaxis family, sensor kinase CheA